MVILAMRAISHGLPLRIHQEYRLVLMCICGDCTAYRLYDKG